MSSQPSPPAEVGGKPTPKASTTKKAQGQGHAGAQEEQLPPLTTWQYICAVIKLGRPKFLMYSLGCQLVGTLVALQQREEVRPDWTAFWLCQATIWCTHLMTHYVNEYGDYEADKLNTNAGTWTGGSKVLRQGLLSRATAAVAGAVLFSGALVCGSACVVRYAAVHGGVDLSPLGDLSQVGRLPALALDVLHAAPWDFVLLGLSTFAVAVAYSLPPLRLSANALGEVCVSYVLTFTTPVVGCLIQGGRLDLPFVYVLLPLFVLNLNRMVVMNIPDREGDAVANKVTSVVLLGEPKAVALNNLVYTVLYCILIPQLPLPLEVKAAYYSVLPLRWWQSLRLNADQWWRNRALTDSIPFVESMFVLTSVCALCAGLWWQVAHQPVPQH